VDELPGVARVEVPHARADELRGERLPVKRDDGQVRRRYRHRQLTLHPDADGVARAGDLDGEVLPVAGDRRLDEAAAPPPRRPPEAKEDEEGRRRSERAQARCRKADELRRGALAGAVGAIERLADALLEIRRHGAARAAEVPEARLQVGLERRLVGDELAAAV